MPISSYKSKKIRIDVDDDTFFEVRGLSLSDAAVIIEVHRPSIEHIYSKIDARKNLKFDEAMIADFVTEIIGESPALVATIICQAADEYDQAATVTQMPLTVQVDALRAIGLLTFRDMAGAKKFGSAVMTLIREMIPARTQDTAEELPGA